MAEQPDPPTQHKLAVTLRIVEALRGGAERRFHWEDVRRQIDLITDGHLFLGGFIPEESSVFYRGRILNGNHHFSDLNELTARAPEYIVSHGRCNKPGQSVLYASNNLETVYSELGLQVDDQVQIIKFRLKKGAQVKFTTVGEADHLRRYGQSSALVGEGYADVIRKHWGKLDELEKLRFNITDAFIADKFRTTVKYPYEYKTTSAFSDIIFSQGFESFFYPRVPRKTSRFMGY